MRNDGYGKYLSEAYDRLNSEVDYGSFADFYEKCFEKWAGVNVRHVCEMACGTGSLAIELKKRGYSVTAFDLSVNMLTFADKKARDEGIEDLRFTNQDMRSFKVYSEAQAVICMMDGLNCLTESGEMREAFESAYDALCPGGLFIFDVNSKYKFEKIYADNAYILEDEDVFLAWQNFYNENTKKCDFYLTFFFEGKDGSYERCDEHVRERLYSVRTLEHLLKDTGFSVECVTSGFDFSAADENTDERIFFICKKV